MLLSPQVKFTVDHGQVYGLGNGAISGAAVGGAHAVWVALASSLADAPVAADVFAHFLAAVFAGAVIGGFVGTLAGAVTGWSRTEDRAPVLGGLAGAMALVATTRMASAAGWVPFLASGLVPVLWAVGAGWMGGTRFKAQFEAAVGAITPTRRTFRHWLMVAVSGAGYGALVGGGIGAMATTVRSQVAWLGRWSRRPDLELLGWVDPRSILVTTFLGAAGGVVVGAVATGLRWQRHLAVVTAMLPLPWMAFGPAAGVGGEVVPIAVALLLPLCLASAWAGVWFDDAVGRVDLRIHQKLMIPGPWPITPPATVPLLPAAAAARSVPFFPRAVTAPPASAAAPPPAPPTPPAVAAVAETAVAGMSVVADAQATASSNGAPADAATADPWAEPWSEAMAALEGCEAAAVPFAKPPARRRPSRVAG